MSALATAIIPVKRFGAAKQRLAERLGPADRARLAAAMLEEVLTAVRRAERIERLIVVSGEPAVGEPARRAGAELIDDPDDRGHSEAAGIGVSAARAAGAARAILLPGDCPLIDPRELDAAIAASTPATAGVIPDRHGSGTNGLLLEPPDAIEPSFGPGSLRRHLRIAAERGVRGRVLELPSLALDLDEPEDLAELRDRLAALPGHGRLAATLAELEPRPASRGR